MLVTALCCLAIKTIGADSKIEAMIATVRKHPVEAWSSDTPGWKALNFLQESSDPRAVEFMIARLNDKWLNTRDREGAYLSLARTGTDAGLAEIVRSQRQPGPLPSLERRMALDRLTATSYPSKLLRQHKDSAGKVWGLVASDVLGNNTDLWLVELTGGRWTHPVFTGVSTGLGRDGAVHIIYPKAERDEHDRQVSALLNGGWIKRFIGNKDLYRESTPCGLTDLEKRRLALDPAVMDSNGNGIPDGLDSCPGIKPRKLSETDRIIAAAFEATFHFSDRSTVTVIDTGRLDVKPFPTPPALGPTMWLSTNSGREVTDILDCDGRGINRFFFGDISLNAERTEATIHISYTMGGACPQGCDCRLRKFGSRWFVTGRMNGWIA